MADVVGSAGRSRPPFFEVNTLPLLAFPHVAPSGIGVVAVARRNMACRANLDRSAVGSVGANWVIGSGFVYRCICIYMWRRIT